MWESILPVCPPNTVCAWFLPAVMLRWSSDNMFSWSDLQLLLCVSLGWAINELKGKLGSLRRRSVKSGRHELESPIPSYPVHLLQNQSWQPGTPIKKWGNREQQRIPVKNWRKRESRFFPGRLVQWPQAYEDKQSKKNTHWHQYEDYKGSQSPFLNPIYINHDAGHQWPQCDKGLWCWIQT